MTQDDQLDQYKGECLCGACRYAISAQRPKAMYLCHCSRCRKETGTIHGANVFFDGAELIWERGEENITHFKLKDTLKERAFCMTCGSPLPKKYGKSHIILPAGSLDENTSLLPTAHVFYASRASWEESLKDLRRFDALPT